MCIQSPRTMLCFYLGIECFPVRPHSSYFLVETWYGVHLLASCLALLHSPLAVPTSPALGLDFSWFCSLHMLCLMEVCEMLLWHCLISICLYTGALAYCKCCLQQQFKGLCRAGETLHSGGLCAVDNRPATCLMKIVRRQICRFASPHSDIIS